MVTLELQNCTFSYQDWFKSVLVFDHINAVFESGNTIILGPNGAGKSTLMSIATGNLRPNSGSVLINGQEITGPHRLKELKRQVAWLPQSIESLPGLKVREQVAYAGWLKGMTRSKAWEHSGEALARVDMAELADRPANRLSGGQKRRMGIAQSLVHDASFVFLDEPTAGLDPIQQEQFQAIVEHNRLDRNFVISTHDVNDLDTRYDQVLVLSNGRIVFHGSVREFLAKSGSGGSEADRGGRAYRAVIEEGTA